MASKFARDRGFEEERFQSAVSDNFKCSICLNVLNEPQSCRNNQHYFCSGCIGEHLENSHTCPECMEELTPETLVQPPRVLLNCILELRIKCHHSERGCPQYVQLGRLQNHADECGFAPAQCGNEGCEADVNRCEKVRHETELCKFRKVECYGCGELKKEIQELRRSQEKANKIMVEKQNEIERKMAELLENQARMKADVKEVLKEDVKEVLKESLHRIDNLFNDDRSDCLPTQSPQASKPRGAQSPQQHTSCRINHDIFVMGGQDKDRQPINTVEKFCSKEGRWIDVEPMIMARESASSVVFDNQVIVSGGTIKVQRDPKYDVERTDSIEVLNLDQIPLKWVMFAAKLPCRMNGHRTFVYKGKLIVVRQHYVTEDRFPRLSSSIKPRHYTIAIYKVLLSPPYTTSKLYSLSNETCVKSGEFTAELINNKLFIFNSYLGYGKIYDLDNNECREMPRLPLGHPLKGMTNVPWRNDIILLGGNGRNTTDHTVLQYSTTTGGYKELAPMNYSRNDCAAVITDDLVIAMGGQDSGNSAECYNLCTNTWQPLPIMRESRYLATAVVSPI